VGQEVPHREKLGSLGKSLETRRGFKGSHFCEKGSTKKKVTKESAFLDTRQVLFARKVKKVHGEAERGITTATDKKKN